MDTVLDLDSYRTIIERVLTEYSQYAYAYGEIGRQTVFDRTRDHYLLMSVGWDKRRVHGCLIHVDLIDGKCWIQRDGTESGIARDLEAAGIPKDRIVLAFRPPERSTTHRLRCRLVMKTVPWGSASSCLPEQRESDAPRLPRASPPSHGGRRDPGAER